MKGNVRSYNALAVGANGTPIGCNGNDYITLSVRFGSFLDEHEFIVTRYKKHSL